MNLDISIYFEGAERRAESGERSTVRNREWGESRSVASQRRREKRSVAWLCASLSAEASTPAGCPAAERPKAAWDLGFREGFVSIASHPSAFSRVSAPRSQRDLLYRRLR